MISRREVNAAIGDRLDDRVEEFFTQYDEDLIENESNATVQNPIFMRNALTSLYDQIGGEGIMD